MKRLLCPLLLLSLAVWGAGCGKQAESSVQPSESAPSTETPPAAPTAASTAAPTEAPAEAEDLLAWGGKTISGFGRNWAERIFSSVEAAGTDEEDADCASFAFDFAEMKDRPGLSLNGSIYLGKDASVLFDIPEEAELDPLAEGFLAEQVKALLPEAKEETLTLGKTVWNVRTVCQNEAEKGFVVYDLIAWSEEGGVLAYVNAAAVLNGSDIGEDAAGTLRDLAGEWFSSLEIR